MLTFDTSSKENGYIQEITFSWSEKQSFKGILVIFNKFTRNQMGNNSCYTVTKNRITQEIVDTKDF